MNKILLKKSGAIHKTSYYEESEVKSNISSFKECLGCKLEIEEGTQFKTLFNIILKDKEFFDIVFKEALHGNSLSLYEKQWKKHAKKIVKEGEGEFIHFLEISKFFELSKYKERIYLEVFPMFIGVQSAIVEDEGDEDGETEDIKYYSLSLLPVNCLKNYSVCVNEYSEIAKNPYKEEYDPNDIIVAGNTTITVYDMINAVLFEISCFGTPEEKQEKKKNAIKQYSTENMPEILEARLNAAVAEENYEEAARLKIAIDSLKKERKSKKNPE